MIELLIKYIQDKGYRVDVYPRVLCISKLYSQDEVCAINWSIPSHDLHPDYEDYLHDIADGYCEQIERGITERITIAPRMATRHL